ncbi:hypothetical protein CVT26_008133 [Gymnopilus dilepis]|uniref:Uncharacterized protein n=1 Tax=Gymnopilus dilepis TaxID=231916 RepID=A0A409YJR7_9AGAR|nr:hypothetical protein CVT26_008133 [Gymnopilus dilepis]
MLPSSSFLILLKLILITDAHADSPSFLQQQSSSHSYSRQTHQPVFAVRPWSSSTSTMRLPPPKPEETFFPAPAPAPAIGLEGSNAGARLDSVELATEGPAEADAEEMAGLIRVGEDVNDEDEVGEDVVVFAVVEVLLLPPKLVEFAFEFGFEFGFEFDKTLFEGTA